MNVKPGSIGEFLDSVRDKLRLRMLIEALLRIIATTCMLLIVSIAANFFGLSDNILRRGFWLAFSIYAIWISFKFILLPARIYRSRMVVASYVESKETELSDSLLSGAQLEKAAGVPHYSERLALEAVKSTVDSLGKFDPAKLVSYKNMRATLVLAISGAISIALAGALAPDRTALAVRTLMAVGVSEQAENSTRLLAGDIRLSYRYPEYTALEPVVIDNSTGDIDAYPGTVVELYLKSTEDAEKGKIQIDQGAELVLTSEGDRRFSGSFTATQQGRYRFVFDGRPDSRWHEISLKKDKKPSVIVDYPAGSLEVRQTDQVQINYRIEDDFGLDAVNLVVDYDAGKVREELKIELERFEGLSKSHAGQWLWELSGHKFVEGDRVGYWIEALDNDSVMGPNVGRSERLELIVFSVHEHHKKLLSTQEQLWEAMIELLAGYLLEDPSRMPITSYEKYLALIDDTLSRLKEALTDPLASLLEQLEQDSLSTEAVEQLLSMMLGDFEANMQAYRKEWDRASTAMRFAGRGPIPFASLASLRRETVRLLEKYIIAMYEMLQKQKYDALVSDAERMAGLRDELRKLIEEYRDSKDEALKQRIEELLKKFRDSLAELQKSMARISKELPEEFGNLEALASKRMDNDLGDLESLLESGDLDQALAQLEDLSQQLNDMLDQLKEGSEELGDSLYSEGMRKMVSASKDLAQLSERQSELLNETQLEDKRYREKLSESMENEIAAKLDKLAKKARQAEADVKEVRIEIESPIQSSRDSALNSIGGLIRVLEASDSFEALEIAVQGIFHLDMLVDSLNRYGRSLMKPKDEEAGLKYSKKAKKLISEVVDELKKILPDPDKLMSEGQKRKMAELSSRQQRLANEGRRISRELNEMAEELPFMPSEVSEQMRQAMQGMRSSRNDLGELQPGKSEGHQQQALHSLKNVEEGMRQAMQKMQNGMKFGGTRSIPRQMPAREMSRDKVAIPKAGNHKAPKELREDLLEAMKKKSPESYEPQNRQYYKELVR